MIGWLRAQVEEDQRTAEATLQASPHWQNLDMDGELRDSANAGTVCIAPEHNTRAHIARHDPARVLREVAAKKAIIEAWELAHSIVDQPGCPDDRRIGEFDGLDEAVRHLAAVYADRPGYDESWRP